MANANTKPTYSEFPNSNIVDEKIRAAFSSKADKATTLAGYGITDAATKREVAAKADLVGGKVPSSQLPSYVDDVLEYANRDAFPEAVSAETGKIYVAKDTNRAYRWGGTGYVEISESLAVGETSGTAYDGAKGKALADVVDILRGDVSRHAARSDNPHAVTAAQVGALPLVMDEHGEETAVTIGSRNSDGTVGKFSLANGTSVTASGYGSHAEGAYTTASIVGSHAEGYGTIASGVYSHAEGDSTTASGSTSHASGYMARTRNADSHAFAWNGDSTRTNPYESHGPGTFNINPYGGLDGFWIGEQTLFSILTNKADKADISSENPTFSNAVLAVGLNIDTNSVAVLNEIAATFGGFPVKGTATTVGGLLAALAAAVAWLKKNKANQSDVDALLAKVDAANTALEEVA